MKKTKNIYFIVLSFSIKYTGMDYDYSLKEINKQIINVCTSKGLKIIDIYSKKFEKLDFYGKYLTL